MSEMGWEKYTELPIDESFDYGTRFAVSDTFGSENVRMSVFRFDPGERGPRHYHNPPGEEYYLILDGKLDIHMEDEIVEAGPGTILYTPSNKEHYPENTYDEPAYLLSVSAPKIPPGSEEGITIVEDVEDV
ncbi:cupin domain-containing protein [Natrarchaeobius chitinivorans]|uniref:Cupin domain-containing protein n=1 Tax=Natrarchaeobius chitinivorans TaxID=1679083 RepID=A0A3N6LXE3_NATCH|nr:cupin domain-containing protein [Natrarchaeobius chitinivorans]RQG95438.1 cupin domain-containing protein [Natrarchaeobius chitinivorans]